jgi:hypothetical protein
MPCVDHICASDWQIRSAPTKLYQDPDHSDRPMMLVPRPQSNHLDLCIQMTNDLTLSWTADCQNQSVTSLA